MIHLDLDYKSGLATVQQLRLLWHVSESTSESTSLPAEGSVLHTKMEISSSSRRPLARVLTGVFIAQVLGKAVVTYLLPHDPHKPETVTSAIYTALYLTAHQDSTLLPPVIALLYNTK
jgi:hypothetical protein